MAHSLELALWFALVGGFYIKWEQEISSGTVPKGALCGIRLMHRLAQTREVESRTEKLRSDVVSQYLRLKG